MRTFFSLSSKGDENRICWLQLCSSLCFCLYRECMSSCMQWRAHPSRPQTKEKPDFLHTGNSLTTACSSLRLESFSPFPQSFCMYYITYDSVFACVDNSDISYCICCTVYFWINPSVLFCRYFLASFYTKYDSAHFVINTASLLSVLIPKLPQLHRVRLFGINKY